MKKIINGKKYDTETATILAEHQYCNFGDFSYFKEELYKKKTGEFFLYGQGGAASRYSKTEGRTSYGSSTIIPYSEAEAREFLAEHGDANKYEEIFGEVAE